MSNCGTCRFWSQMIARASGGGPVQAMCLGAGGPLNGKYTPAYGHCSGWKHDDLGKVDDPPDYGEYERAAYLAEEGEGALRAEATP